MLKLITIPNKVLTTPVKKVIHIDARVQKTIKEMEKVLDAQSDPEGVGLAAPQVGLSLAIFIIKPTEDSSVSVFINPKIVKSESEDTEGLPRRSPEDFVGTKTGLPRHSKEEARLRSSSFVEAKEGKKEKKAKSQLEGCLSIPYIWSPIKRVEKVLLEYQDVSGKQHTAWFSGFDATIIQHEVDHLQGILFTQRAVEQKVKIFREEADELKPVDI